VGSTFEFVAFVVGITAPAPPSGYEIPLTLAVLDANGKPITMPPWMDAIQRGMKVPAGKTEAFYAVYALPVESTAVIQVTAKDPMTHNSYDAELTVERPKIRGVQIEGSMISGVPLGGKEVDVDVQFWSPLPQHGIAYDVTYAGTTDIKGPARIRTGGGSNNYHFKVRVFPCAVNPPCQVSVSLGGYIAKGTVTP
jgi:hypothetical protein